MVLFLVLSSSLKGSSLKAVPCPTCHCFPPHSETPHAKTLAEARYLQVRLSNALLNLAYYQIHKKRSRKSKRKGASHPLKVHAVQQSLRLGSDKNVVVD